MARVIVVGGGIVGMSAALLLARDGHDVTVLERDPSPPPDPGQAWDAWDRRGVNQFRMLHFLQPRFRSIMAANVPEVITSLEEAGALVVNPFRSAPAEVTGGFRDSDAEHDALTARRPVAEAALARVVAATPNIIVHRGIAVAGLIAADAPAGAPPHVVGVRSGAGDEWRADLVIDACGRRSALPAHLTAIGATAPTEEKEDCGFVYFGRHFRSGDGSTPFPFGPLLMPFETISILTLPADNGTWGVGIVASAADTALRGLTDVAAWTKVIAGHPLVAHWLEGEPLDDGVAVMAKIEDRHRSFVVDGRPVATGVLALADSWACTNPSVGRGISIGAVHALALRDLLRDAPSDPIDLALLWHDLTMATVEPWYRDTLSFDRSRLDQIQAAIEGREFKPTREYEMTLAMQSAAMKDPAILRAFLETAGVVSLPSQVLSRPGLAERIVELGHGWRNESLPGLSREDLLAVVAA